MASPDVFLSSPLRAPSRPEASSPDELPPLREIILQASSRPPIKSGSKATPIPEEVETSFTSAREHWKAAVAAGRNEDPDTSVIEIDPPLYPPSVPKSRKPRAKPATRPRKAPTAKGKKVAKEPVAKANSPVPARSSTGSPTGEQPWRKYVASPPAKVAVEKGLREERPNDSVAVTSLATPDDVLARDPIVEAPVVTEAKSAKSAKLREKRSRKQTGTMCGHFKSKETTPIEPPKIEVMQEECPPLERAAERRLDWTPPKAQTDTIDVTSDTSLAHEVSSSSAGVDRANFNNMVKNYSCQEDVERDGIAVSDEDSSFMKKRKLVELVQTRNSGRQEEPPTEERSPVKQKAPKKKARTITDLATAAYRQPEPIANETPATITDHLENPERIQKRGTVDNAKGKGKGKQRKRSVKAPKKRAAPPKRLLLSPETALKEVSKQDFLFGTSSQLAREQSPSMLRDIQQAIKNSTQISLDSMSDPFKSDPIETPVRPELWRAGTRDADGQLFDSLLVDMADKVTFTLRESADDDPFGYLQAEKGFRYSTMRPLEPYKNPKSKEAPHPLPDIDRRQLPRSALDRGTDAGITTEHIDTALEKQPVEIISDDSSFSSSQLSISSDVQKRKNETATITQMSSIEPSLPQQHPSTEKPESDPQRSRPQFEQYSDSRLVQAIRDYGFKPVKKRPDMIALLDQCWKSMTHAIPSASQHFSTFAQVEKPLASGSAPQGDKSPTRVRGRPRKVSVSASESQDHPPSAQVSDSPKRPRGRPRKDASSPAKPASSKSQRATSPRRKKQPENVIVEIPDSESDGEEVLTSSPSPSPSSSQPDSPPRHVHVSPSMIDDKGDLSLAITPDDSEEALFGSISKAVTSAPRSTDPDNPSWYEKMLLYDPIIVEDLTLWLNLGQLGKVGHDGEVSPAEVKKWCESRSICCLWKVNLRGKERKRL